MLWSSRCFLSMSTTSAVDEIPHFITSFVKEQYLFVSLSTLHACYEHVQRL